MNPRKFYSKHPHPILWAGSRTALAKMGVIAIPNSLNYCVLFIGYIQLTIVASGRITQPGGPLHGLETHDLTFPLSNFLEFSHSGGRDKVVRVCSVDMKLGTNRLRYSSCKCTAEMYFVSR